jgi:eukaryotic-like serine/threonine-protein kinase
MEEDAEPAAPSGAGARRVTERDGVDGEPAPPLSSDERVGRYVIQSFLAEGGMGVVYVARDPELGRKVALKLVKTRGGADAALRERLLREAQALAQLSHPNVIAVHDVGLHDDRVFIAMELIEGVSLRTWLERRRRWHEVLRVLVAAGRGLAAAHTAGIVHRDFKPDNVIVGHDGRVCVLDFGLARAAESDMPDHGGYSIAGGAAAYDQVETVTLPVDDDRQVSVDRERLEVHLTGHGTVLGTPAYMSPEHHRGEAVTAASDQFSFCVSAWEALYGRRPYAAQGDSLREAKEQRRVTPPPRGSAVPWRVRRLLLRGLAPQPAERHPSMAALLDAVERARRAPRRYAQTGAAVLAMAGMAAALSWRHAAPELCSEQQARARLRGAWDAALAAQVEDAFARSLPAAARAAGADSARRVRGALDGYADAWVAMRVDSCAATHERHDQSMALLDLRTHCLDQRREALRALTALLARSRDAAVAERALQAALGLPVLEECADARVLGESAPLPDPPAQRAAIAAARRQLAEVRALVATGQYGAALVGARAGVAAARATGHSPVLADALEAQASIEEDLDQLDAALATARQAALTAGLTGDHARVALALIDVMSTLGRQARFAEALALATPIEAVIAATGQRVSLRATFQSTLGRVYSSEGDYPQAIAALQSAVALRESEAGATSWRLASSLNSLGDALRAHGRHAEARAQFARALSITEATFGSNHPNAGAVLNNLALVFEADKRFDEARQMYERSLAIDELTFGPRNVRVAISLLNLGTLLYGQGDQARAQPMLERALSIYRGALGPQHPDVAMALHNLGNALMSVDDVRGAEARYREALAIFEKSFSPEHANLALPLGGIGEALIAQRRAAEATPYFARALAIQEKALGADDLGLAYALDGLARAQLRSGRASAAIASAERLLEIYRLAGERAEPVAQAESQFLLAQALAAARRERGRARSLAVQAREALATAASDPSRGAAKHRLREVERWLAGAPR